MESGYDLPIVDFECPSGRPWSIAPAALPDRLAKYSAMALHTPCDTPAGRLLRGFTAQLLDLAARRGPGSCGAGFHRRIQRKLDYYFAQYNNSLQTICHF